MRASIFNTKSRYASRKNPCWVCGKDHGCRLFDDGTVFCIRVHHPSDVHGTGGRFVKALRNGMGAMVVPDNGVRYRPNPVERNPEPKPKHLSDSEINQNYRLLVSQLRLHDRHKAALIRERGLTRKQVAGLEQIGFKSFVPRKRTHGVDTRLPGLKPDGSLVGTGGMLIPAYTPDQLLLGFQIASDRRDKSKYLWLKGSTKHRETSGPLLFTAYGLPDYSDRPRTIPEAVLYFASSVKPGTDDHGRKLGHGEAGVGAVLTDPLGNPIKTVSKHFKKSTLIQADYNGLLLGLQMALDHGVQSLSIFGDSEVVIHQILGEASVLRPELQVLHHLCTQLLNQQRAYTVQWTPSQYNGLAHDAAHRGRVDNEDCGTYFDLRELWTVDGALKTYLTATKHGVVVVGCPGNQHTSNDEDLQRYLKALSPERVVVMPDAGDVLNFDTALRNRAVIQAVEGLGYDVAVGWWGQTCKPKATTDPGDIDEVDPDTPIQYLTPDQFLDLHPVSIREKLDQARLHRPGIQEFDEPVQHPRPVQYRTPTHYKRGDRLAVIKGLIEQGHRFSEDNTPAGLGKSTDVSQWQPHDFGAYQIAWVVDDPVSLEYPTWEQYRGRDAGRIVRSDGRVIKAAPGTSLTELYKQPNCQRSARSDYLAGHNVVPSVDTVCIGCSWFDDKSCQNGPGRYLHDRGAALSARRLRLPASALGAENLRAADGRSWDEADPDTRQPGVVIVVDDVDPWVQQTSVTLATVQTVSGQLLPLLEQAPELRQTLGTLQTLLPEKQGQRWVNRSHRELLAEFPTLPELKTELLTAIYGIEEDLVLGGDPDDQTQKVNTVWLRDFIEVLRGAGGYLYSYKGRLYINRVNQRFVDAVTHPAVIHCLFMDATGKVEHLQQWLKGHVTSPIPLIAQETPAEQGQLKLTQVIGLGDLGYNRSPNQKQTLEQLKAQLRTMHPGFAEIDIKGAITPGDLVQAEQTLALKWRSTSRGSNAAKDHPGLICYGTPRANLSAAVARYCLMTAQTDIDPNTTLTAYPLRWSNKPGHWGRVMVEAANPGFSEFYHYLTTSEVWQGYNRLRHAIRPGETLQVIHVTEYPLGLPCDVVEADKLLNPTQPDEEKPDPLSVEAVVATLQYLSATKQALTQKAAAKHLGVGYKRLTHFIQRSEFDWDTLRTLSFYPPERPETLEKSVEYPTTQPYIYISESTPGYYPTLPENQGFQAPTQPGLGPESGVGRPTTRQHPELAPVDTPTLDTDPEEPRFKTGDRVRSRAGTDRAVGVIRGRSWAGDHWRYDVLFSGYVNQNYVLTPDIVLQIRMEDLHPM